MKAIALSLCLFASMLLSVVGSARAQVSDAATTDWSVAMVDSTMKRFTPSSIGGWSYPVGLYLHGQYLVFKRTGNPAYLQFIKDWANLHVDASGNISQSFDNLDSMLAGRVLVDLFHETGDTRYQIAATKIRNRLKTYPRTSDGGFWHATSKTNQLWGDGTYMLLPFLQNYGHTFNDATYTDQETANQLIIYHSHLTDPITGLHFHAFAGTGTPWPMAAGTRHSQIIWCRALGWYMMATIEVLELLPQNDPNRAQLISILQGLTTALAKVQDPATGRWFQVLDQPNVAGNFLETSSSQMFTFAISRAIQRGYVDASFQSVVDNGYKGVLSQISLDSSGMTNLTNICEGTNIGTIAYYLARKRNTNDFHGLGSFLIMNEQILSASGGNKNPDFSILATPSSQGVTSGAGASYTISVVSTNGYNGTVGLSASVSGAPAGVTTSFAPAAISGGTGSSTLTVSTSASTPSGSYAITVTGTDTVKTGLFHSAMPVTLAVSKAAPTPTPGGPTPTPTPTPTTSGCVSTQAPQVWTNTPFAAQTGTFTATFDASPGAATTINDIIALSQGAQTNVGNFPVIVSFSDTGHIVARDGASYTATNSVVYSAGSVYHFRLVVNLPAHMYSVFVTPPGGTEVTIGSNFAFRTGVTPASLNSVGSDVTNTTGSVSYCNFSVN